MIDDYALDAVNAAEQAAIAAYKWIGRGEKDAADQAAVDAMRAALNEIDFTGRVVIGEGERDEAPMLYIGEVVGTGQGLKIDIALDPLEGTDLTAQGRENALAVIAFAEEGGFLHAPDVYMEKIAVGGGLPKDIIGLDAKPEANLKELARAKNCEINELTVCILDRSRHSDIVAKVREAGAKIKLIQDGDVNGVISTSLPASGVDMYLGTGGAPEGVLAAAALRAIGGQMETRLIFRDDAEKERAAKAGITDYNRKYKIDDLAKGHVLFAATGVTPGTLVKGLKKQGDFMATQTILMDSHTGLSRYISTTHYLGGK